MKYFTNYLTRGNNQKLFILVMIVSIFSTYVVFLIRSDIYYIAYSQLQDDSYYYLLPAWNFKSYGFYTFDGISKTYGFQPLWMVIITIIAYIIPTKTMFINVILLLGCLLYLFSGYIILLISQKIFDYRSISIVPAILWIINVYLLRIFSSGKENSLFCFIFLLIVYRIFSDKNNSKGNNYLIFGSLIGLLVLTRVNNIIIGSILTIVYLFYTRSISLKHIGLLVISFTMPVILWSTYAKISFGTSFPNSGAAKLIVSKASLVYLVDNKISIDISSFLTSEEKLLLSKKETLDIPQLSKLINYSFDYIPRSVVGVFLSKKYSDEFKGITHFNQYAFYIFLVGSIFYVFLKRKEQYVNIKKLMEITILLSLISIMNTIPNWLLFQRYLSYTNWYATPEIINIHIIISNLIVISLLGWKKIFEYLNLSKNISYLFICLFFVAITIAPLYRIRYELAPRQYDRNNIANTFRFFSYIWQVEDLEATLWMQNNIPPDIKVGSWNAGIIGYFSDNQQVVNLDGLANSPNFVNTVLINNILYRRGLTDTNELLTYMKANNIQYIIDSWYEKDINTGQFNDLIPAQNYDVVFASNVVFYDGFRNRRMYILKLRY